MCKNKHSVVTRLDADKCHYTVAISVSADGFIMHYEGNLENIDTHTDSDQKGKVHFHIPLNYTWK